MRGRGRGALRLRRALVRTLAVAGFGAGLWLAAQAGASASADELPAREPLTGPVAAVVQLTGLEDLRGSVVDTLPERPVTDLLPPAVRPILEGVVGTVVPVVEAVTEPALALLDRTPAAPVVDAVVRPVLDAAIALPGDASTPATPPPPTPHGPAVVPLPAPPAAIDAPPATDEASTGTSAVGSPVITSSVVPAAGVAGALPGDASEPGAPEQSPLPAGPSALPPVGTAPSSAGAGPGTDLPPAALSCHTSPVDGDHPSGARASGSAPPLGTPANPAASPD